MKVAVEVTVKILDGEEKGKICTFQSVEETKTEIFDGHIIRNVPYESVFSTAEDHKSSLVIERLNFEWTHLHRIFD